MLIYLKSLAFLLWAIIGEKFFNCIVTFHRAQDSDDEVTILTSACCMDHFRLHVHEIESKFAQAQEESE